jgi:indolepyruvate ferredoxin oxidoreductase alpha subunit
MTGHQDHAASGRNFNEVTEKIPVRGVLEGLGVKHIYEVDTYQQDRLTRMVKEALQDDGFSVVIAKHPCMLKFTRKQRSKPGYQVKRVDINQATCVQTHECVASFGCPTFSLQADGRVRINEDLCIGDGSCVQTCPLGAIEKPA